MRMRGAHRAAVVVAGVVGTAMPAAAEVAVPSYLADPTYRAAPMYRVAPTPLVAPTQTRSWSSPIPGVEAPRPRAPAPTPGRWAWPLSPMPAVEREFVAPGSAWGAGHRGIDLSGAAGAEVLAVEGGTVTHVGVIAGRGTVSVLHRDGLRSTYEPVTAGVRVGDAVTTGQAIGIISATGAHCRAACLHLGARRSDAYVDPLPLLRRPRIILLPLP